MTMRVAVLCSYYPPHVGGIASQVQGTAHALAELGAEVHIITRHWEQGPVPVAEHSGVFSRSVERDGVVVHRIKLRAGRWQASPAYIWQAAALAHRLQPDVIHAHELLLPATTALLAKRLGGAPVVVTVHSSGPDLGECARLARTKMGAQRVQYVRKSVDGFVAISRAVAADMAAIGIPEDRRVLIPNGVDVQRFVPVAAEEKARLRRSLGLPAGALVIYTGRLSSEKRVLPLAQQWQAVRLAQPDATLVLVGDGPEKAALQELGAPGVLLVGAQADVASFLQCADLFVMPSVTEGFSLTTLEALACGLPGVATAVGAVPELLCDGVTGRLVAPDDMRALLAALSALLAQRSSWQSMGNSARAHVEQEYALDIVAQRLLNLYRRV